MEYYVYILQSEKSGIYYKGQTNNIFDRLSKHNSGYVHSTKAYRPWKLVFYTNVETRSEAVRLERKLKNLKSKSRLEEWMLKNKDINKYMNNWWGRGSRKTIISSTLELYVIRGSSKCQQNWKFWTFRDSNPIMHPKRSSFWWPFLVYDHYGILRLHLTIRKIRDLL